MKPNRLFFSLSWAPFIVLDMSKTATASRPALATKTRVPSIDCAKATGDVPGAFCPDNEMVWYPNGRSVSVLTSATWSMFESATYNVFSLGLKSIAVGCEPGASGSSIGLSLIQCATLPLVRSSSATCEAFQRLHQARRPSRVATTVYG